MGRIKEIVIDAYLKRVLLSWLKNGIDLDQHEKICPKEEWTKEELQEEEERLFIGCFCEICMKDNLCPSMNLLKQLYEESTKDS